MKKIMGIPKNWINEIKNLVFNELENKPPTIGVIGVSGVGKSSTLNALFKTSLPTSDTIACTKEFRAESLTVKFNKDKSTIKAASLIVIDAPGLGEDIDLDEGYFQMYRENLSRCDVILWVMTGRNRALALDQLYLKQLLEFKYKMVFAINQVELIEPQSWNTNINTPNQDQLVNISIIERDKKEKIEKVLDMQIPICSYSAHKKYNLELLFSLIISTCPSNRKWIFEGLKNFHYSDFLPEEIKKLFTI